MRHAFASGIVLAAGAAAADPAATAGKFDGTYRQGAASDCARVGADGGALRIENNVFYGVEMQCRMDNPVNVRDMDAVLYDMICSGEGTGWTARAMFMRSADDGLIMVWNGYAFKYDRCTGSPAVAQD